MTISPLPLLATACAAASLALAACGGDDPAKDRADADKAFDGAVKFARCMRQHGVDTPDPKRGPGGGVLIQSGVERGHGKGAAPGPESPRFKAANAACAKYLEDGGGTPSPAEQAEQRDATVAFARCMRSKGIDMPDPEVRDGHISMRIAPGARPGTAKFRAAEAACRPLMARGAPGAGAPGPEEGK